MAEITKALYELARKAQSADEIAGIAEGAGIELAEGEAEALFERLHVANEGAIADEELDNVAGGGCDFTPPTVQNGGKCRQRYGVKCNAACYYYKPHDDDPNLGYCGNPHYLP